MEIRKDPINLQDRIKNDLEGKLRLIQQNPDNINSQTRVSLQLNIYLILRDILEHVQKHGVNDLDISPLAKFSELIKKTISETKFKSRIHHRIDVTLYSIHSIYYTIEFIERLIDIIESIRKIDNAGEDMTKIRKSREFTGLNLNNILGNKNLLVKYRDFLKLAIYSELETLSQNTENNIQQKKHELQIMKNRGY
ncbi:MAG: hypothetical protein N3C61_02605 [Candidatus Micrarchaeota archaeon]|nr:hypothetical protein [Candidatus Micrarchaeota archaeon]